MPKDYAGTPLAVKLGAKPGIGVLVCFTTSRADLERRFADLKATLDPADGLWIAWPKKAAKLECRAQHRPGEAHPERDEVGCLGADSRQR